MCSKLKTEILVLYQFVFSNKTLYCFAHNENTIISFQRSKSHDTIDYAILNNATVKCYEYRLKFKYANIQISDTYLISRT